MRDLCGLVGVTALLAGCAVPSQYAGISTQGTFSDADLTRAAVAIEQGKLGTGHCPWPVTDPETQEKKLSKLPCEILPTFLLADLAWSDHKHAILELGKRFEEGRGVKQDLAKAEEMYERAAKDSVGGTAVNGGHGYEPVTWTSAYGLPEARERLLALRAKRDAR